MCLLIPAASLYFTGSSGGRIVVLLLPLMNTTV